MKKNSWLWIVVLLCITLIPVIVVLYTKSKNNFRNSAAPKPIWPVGVDEKGDTTFFQLPNFTAMNADSSLVSTMELNGKITVIETFFSTCQSICPIMNRHMTRVYDALSINKQFQIFSYTVDPERDDLQTLRAYAENHGADLHQWKFLRAEQDSIYQFGRWSLKLPVGEGEEVGNFLHSERFVLVDWNRNIRGYYDGTDSVSVNRMMNDAVLLMSEKERMDKKQINAELKKRLN